MRNRSAIGLAALAALVAACQSSYPQKPQDPINANPKPQSPVTDPEPQAFGAGWEPTPQRPLNDPAPQKPALRTPGPQAPINDPSVQAPFYGPGLVAPEDRPEARAKAKQPLSSDGEILSVAVAIDDGELQMAELAKRMAVTSDVKSLATTIASDHQKSMTKIREVQGKAKIELKANDVTSELKGDIAQNMTMLRQKSGREFDRAYVETQVRLHKKALEIIDTRLVPGARDSQVKGTVGELRGYVADHLAKSESLLEKLDPTTSSALRGSEDKAGAKTAPQTSPKERGD